MADRRRELGALGEQLAARHLAARGFEVLERNFRTRFGELDIVAASSRHLVICEVKTRVGPPRPGGLGPLASVGARKRRRLRLMAREWLAARADREGRRPQELRFDAIGICLASDGRLLALEHVEDAF